MVKFERKGFKPYRRYFIKKADADADCEAFNDKLLAEGREGQHIGPRERRLFADIVAACEEVAISPVDVPFLIRKLSAESFPKRKISIEVQEFLVSLDKAGRAYRTQKTLKLRLNAFRRHCGKVCLGEVTEADCREFIFRPNSPQTQTNDRRALHQFFAWAVKGGRLAANPISRIETPSRARDAAPAILRPAEARIWFARMESKNNARILAPYFALSLFAGLRPSEIAELRPEDLTASGIRVTGGKMRGRKRRIVPRFPVLDAWLAAYPPSFDWPAVDSTAMKNARALCPRRWAVDLPRHTWISARLALTNDENKTAREAGNSPAMIYAHYFETMRPEKAALFDSIRPIRSAKAQYCR